MMGYLNDFDSKQFRDVARGRGWILCGDEKTEEDKKHQQKATIKNIKATCSSAKKGVWEGAGSRICAYQTG